MSNWQSIEIEELKEKNKILDESLRHILNEIEKLDLYCGCESPCDCKYTREQHLLLGIKHHVYGTYMEIDKDNEVST